MRQHRFRPSQCFVLIKQSDSPAQRPVLNQLFHVPQNAAPKDNSAPLPAAAEQQPSLRLATAKQPPSKHAAKAPNLQSHSLSQSYGTILPTSLTYVLLSTRGCSPWRPDAVMGTTRRESISLPRLFKERRKCTGHHTKSGALPAVKPYLLPIRFQGTMRVKQKRQLCPGLSPSSPSSFASPHKSSTARLRTFNPIPFRAAQAKPAFETEFPQRLGSTHPCPINVRMEPFSTSVFKVLT